MHILTVGISYFIRHLFAFLLFSCRLRLCFYNNFLQSSASNFYLAFLDTNYTRLYTHPTKKKPPQSLNFHQSHYYCDEGDRATKKQKDMIRVGFEPTPLSRHGDSCVPSGSGGPEPCALDQLGHLTNLMEDGWTFEFMNGSTCIRAFGTPAHGAIPCTASHVNSEVV